MENPLVQTSWKLDNQAKLSGGLMWEVSSMSSMNFPQGLFVPVSAVQYSPHFQSSMTTSSPYTPPSQYAWALGCEDIVELRTPATPVGVGGGKERGGCHLNLRTWHAEGRRPILGLCWPSLGLCWPILRLCWPMPMRTKCCNLQHFALWDGKNPCKYNSFSPRKWLKHSYLQSFVHITIFAFLKNV